MRYTLAPFHCRPWLLNYLSTKLIESHYENNYGGAMRRLNAIADKLAALDLANTPPFVVAALKRDELIALNSTLLHELYFASLGGDGAPTAQMKAALAQDFGSYQRWKDEFTAMGNALGGGSGWVLLTYVPRDKRLINQYASEHSQAVAGAIPILALDMYEHAYHMDFGANAPAYVLTFMRNIDWKALQRRYEDARGIAPPRPLVQEEYAGVPSVAPEEVKAMLDEGKPVQVIDARPKASYERNAEIMDGATWRDPERVKEWMGDVSKSEPVVVYCAYGFHVGCNMAIALREAGYDARYMSGGHSAWKAIGGKMKIHG